MKRNMHLDDLLSKWAFDPSTLNVRLVKGNDGRDVIQMRVDMGVLQLETTGRPDGELAHDHQSMLEFLQEESLKDADRDLTEDECMEVDREFMQFYHRRICWLRLQYYHRAVMDADHTLQLMDVSEKMSPEEEWGRNSRTISPIRPLSPHTSRCIGRVRREHCRGSYSGNQLGARDDPDFFRKA